MSMASEVCKNTGKLLLGGKNLKSSGGSMKMAIKCLETTGFSLGAAALLVGGIVIVIKAAQDFGKPIERIGRR